MPLACVQNLLLRRSLRRRLVTHELIKVPYTTTGVTYRWVHSLLHRQPTHTSKREAEWISSSLLLFFGRFWQISLHYRHLQLLISFLSIYRMRICLIDGLSICQNRANEKPWRSLGVNISFPKLVIWRNFFCKRRALTWQEEFQRFFQVIWLADLF